MPAKERSVLPALKGLPWWGAVLLAVGATAIGAVIDTDAGSTLGRWFKLFYLAGCLLAALAVRQRALFTAAAQPPLIAFIVGVTALYTINSGNGDQGLKEIILKVVLPIATSFPWILLTFLLTLAVVIVRWYLARPKGKPFFGKGGGRRPAAASKAQASQADASKTGASKTRSSKASGRTPGARKPAAETKSGARRPTGQRAGAAKVSAQKAVADKGGMAAGDDRTRAAQRPPRPRSEETSSGRSATTKRRPTDGSVPAKSASASAGPDRPRRQPTSDAGPTTRIATRPSPPAQAPTASTGSARPDVRRRPAAPSESRRRAAPQTIPARDPNTPRRTAGQLRDTGAIEDLTAGADDR